MDILSLVGLVLATVAILVGAVLKGAGIKALLSAAAFMIVVVGEFNAGKSAFVSALLGHRVFEEGVTPTTARIQLIRYGAAIASGAGEAGTAGDTAFASDCRAFNGAGTQEVAGSGTGAVVTYNGSAWKIAGTNVTAVA